MLLQVTFEQIPDQACRTANRNSWDPIATLDEEENWTERTHFITQEDHLIYKEVAQVQFSFSLTANNVPKYALDV